MKKTFKLFILTILFFSNYSIADIYITLSATLIKPSCIVTNENGSNELIVNFHDIPIDKIAETKQEFSVLITKCDLNKSLKMYLSPKEGNTLTINNETVLATSTEGLGIRFSEENSTNALNLYNWTTINPTIVNGTGKLKIQSQLVTNKSAEDLTSGPFKAAVSLMIDYL